MSRYIDADMLRAKLCGWLDCVYQTTEGGQWDDGAGGAIAECVQELDKTPTADVAPVVRCKNCVHFCPYCFWLDGSGWCDHMGLTMEENDFCSHGAKVGEEVKA